MGDPPSVRGDRRLVWYPAVFDRPSLPINEDGKTFVEVIRPGAFTRTLAEGLDVHARVEHDAGRTIATRSNGLLLQEDARGLFASVYLPQTPEADALLADVRAGKFRGGSFGFRTRRDRWNSPAAGDKFPLVEQLEVDLVEVTITGTPAYPDTVLSLRAEAARIRERRLRLEKLR
jgi:HK97 family phage prohead protease